MLRNPSKHCTSGPTMLNSAHMFGRPSSQHPPQRQCTCQVWCGVCECESVVVSGGLEGRGGRCGRGGREETDGNMPPPAHDKEPAIST
jgi:hypothetical protein